MKKSITALAAMACLTGAGTAWAQSNVTIYGRMDASAGADKVNGVSTTRLYSGNLSTSRLGFRGTEDLGGGLKAIFTLEGALGVDTGAFGGFDRQSIVGLSGGFGTVKLGRHDTSFDDIRDISVSSNLWDSEFSPTKIAYTAGVADYSSRASNQIRYESPSFGGFTVGVGYGLDEDATVKADVVSYNLRYRNGPLDVGIGFQDQKGNNREYTAISGAYDFGVARVSAGYNRAEITNGAKADGYSIGVNVPMGNLDFSVGYAYSKAKAAGATTAKGSALAAGVTYALSKRTRLYGALLDGNVENGAGVTTTDRRLYSVGVRHDF
ncbi:porin [Hydrogenophaga sp.]|uniref:porin n=1 Tax=Hydrogenophaga sp. TaxID=1904254 RepID=UPI00261CF486|nr:porin [Hydrogenophaga sp.]MCW5654411.1 porin [Hydrogenophaga sp.]